MSGYTPAFSSIYDGSLCGKWPAAAVWASLLPLVDVRGEIRLTYEAISARTGWPLDLLHRGIAELMQPDPQSQSPDEGGRRLVLINPSLTWGWRAVNHERYREKARKQIHDNYRAATGGNRERMRSRNNRVDAPAPTRADPRRPALTRADSLGPASTGSQTQTQTHTHKEEIYIGRTDEYVNTKPAKRRSPTRAARPLEPEELSEFRVSYPPRAGSQPWRRAIAQIRARIEEGHTWEELIAGAQRYRKFCEATNKRGTEFVMQVCTFVGAEKHFLADWKLPEVPPEKETSEQKSLRNLTARRAAIGLADFREPAQGESSKDYARAQDEEWNRRKLAQSLKRLANK